MKAASTWMHPNSSLTTPRTKYIPRPRKANCFNDGGKWTVSKPLAFDIDKTPKTHAFPTRGVGFFDRDFVPHHFDCPPDAVRQRFAAHATFGNGLGLGGQQPKRRNQREPKQLNLVERDFEVVSLKTGQGEPGDVWREERGIGGSFLGVDQAENALPTEVVGGSCR